MWVLVFYSILIAFLIIYFKKGRRNLIIKAIGAETTVEIIAIDTIRTAHNGTSLSLMIFEDEFTNYCYAIIDDIGLNSEYKLSIGDRLTAEIIDNSENPQMQAISFFIEGRYCTAMQILEGEQ